MFIKYDMILPYKISVVLLAKKKTVPGYQSNQKTAWESWPIGEQPGILNGRGPPKLIQSGAGNHLEAQRNPGKNLVGVQGRKDRHKLKTFWEFEDFQNWYFYVVSFLYINEISTSTWFQNLKIRQFYLYRLSKIVNKRAEFSNFSF